MDPIRISAVSYLNTKPFIYGISNSPVSQEVLLTLDTPALCANKLKSGEADIGLIPVVAIDEIPGAHIISNYGIGARGPVGSVLLVSESQITEVNEILLDYQSMTSVELTKILTSSFWHIQPRLIDSSPGFEELIKGRTAGLLIGDRALLLRNKFNYVYDLSGTWTQWTKLPFVFACWVSTRLLPQDFILKFESALAMGCNSIDELIRQDPAMSTYYPDVEIYLKNQISYHMDDEMKKGMSLFLSLLQKNVLLK